MTSEQIDIDGVWHPVAVRRSRRKTIGLYLSRRGEIEVRAPLRCPGPVIRSFLDSRRSWLSASLRRLETLPAPPEWRDGASFPILGEPVRLAVRSGERRAIRRVGDCLRLTVSGAPTPQAVEGLVREWFRRQARPVFEQVIADWWPRLDLPEARYPPLKLRAMRRRWGSCASHGGINLNLWLLGAPRACIDFVVAHELCHLREFHHGPGFYRLMDRVMPDWRAKENRLREHERRFPLS